MKCQERILQGDINSLVPGICATIFEVQFLNILHNSSWCTHCECHRTSEMSTVVQVMAWCLHISKISPWWKLLHGAWHELWNTLQGEIRRWQILRYHVWSILWCNQLCRKQSQIAILGAIYHLDNSIQRWKLSHSNRLRLTCLFSFQRE